MTLIDFLPHLACPGCGGSLAFDCGSEGAQEGWLVCGLCVARTPVMDGVAFFSDTEMDAGERKSLATRRCRIVGTDEEWGAYLAEREQRQSLEPYAAFAPFNEAHRAARPLLDPLREDLPEGSLIVDMNNRTGWSAEWLAGMFPQCIVAALWEGDSSVLGYRGFLRLMNATLRSPNLLLMFSTPGARAPIRPQSAMLVHTHDSLHRLPQPGFINDCLSILHRDGTLIAAHVHLSNNEPSPFFERGGVHRHGTVYQSWLTARLHGDPREGRVFSEAELFNKPNLPLAENGAETIHYNGLISVARPTLFERATAPCASEPTIERDTRCISNPLIRVNPLLGRAMIDGEALGGQSLHLLERHPVYRERLDSLSTLQLEIIDLRLLDLCEQGMTVAEMAEVLNLVWDEAASRTAHLARNELIMPAPVARQTVILQRFHSGDHCIIDRALLRCWNEWMEAAPDKPFGDFLGTTITRSEAGELLAALLRYLTAQETSGIPPVGAERSCSPMTALVSLAFVACGAKVDDSSPKETLDLRTTPEGDVVIALPDKPEVRLVDLLEIFNEGSVPEPSPPMIDPHWWKPVIAVLAPERDD